MLRNTFFILFLFLLSWVTAGAADRYWIAAGPANWNNAANWSASSGGAGGASVPVAGDNAIFDGNGLGICGINVNVNVDGIDVRAGFSGFITQGSGFTITIGTNNFQQAAGNFAGGDSDFTINGTFSLTGGTFTSTSASLILNGNQSANYTPFSYTGGTFNHNNGLVSFSTNWTTGSARTATVNLPSSTNFYDVELVFDENGGNPNNKFLATSGGNMVALNDFTHTDGVFSGTLEVRNDLFVLDDADGGLGRILMNGSAASEYTGSSSGRTAELEVDNTMGVTPATGTTNLLITALILTNGDFTGPSGTMSIGGNRSSNYDVITQTSGTFSHNSGLTLIETNWTTGSARTATINLSSSVDFYDVELAFDENGGNPNNKFLASGGMNLIVLNDFTHTDGAFNTTFEVRNDLFVGSDSDGGTGRIIMNGSGPSEYTFSGAAARTAELEIDNGAGVTPAAGTTDLSITALFLTSGDFTAPSGTMSIGGSRSSNYDIITQTAGTFTNNNGLVILEPNWTTGSTRTASINLATSLNLFDLTFDNQGSTSNKFFSLTSGDLMIEDQLDLTDDILLLNANQITIDNSSDTAIQRNTGMIRGENTSGLSMVQWNIGTGTGTYEYPFGSASNTYIPFIYDVTAAGTESGGTGSLAVATYPTGANNLPLPPGVSNINNGSGGNNSAFVIDRYWILTPGNYSVNPTADYTFSYEESDHTTSGNTITESNLQAERYDSSVNDWDQLSLTGTIDTGNNTLVANGVNTTGVWTLVDITSPLPVELISFEVALVDNEVVLKWSTASEKDNDFFTVERSSDGQEFDGIFTVEGAGTSEETLSYHEVDPEPLRGRSFYRLKQTDFDGQFEYSEIRSVENLASFREIVVFPNPVVNGKLKMRFEGMEGEEVAFTVSDVLGKTIQSGSMEVADLYHELTIDVSDNNAGVYYVWISTITGVEAHKLIID
ncbi:MAG: hypothetical protein DHS20C17_16480 [Cyclobacteriaceae bacterium]|nr:MAG: hypothetical protein DHS20C17_16480 [Cyclobacteriaceae bacterium]